MHVILIRRINWNSRKIGKNGKTHDILSVLSDLPVYIQVLCFANMANPRRELCKIGYCFLVTYFLVMRLL